MNVHPRQFISAVKHIHKFWPKGCKCVLCTAVDNREELSRAKGKEKEPKEFKTKDR